MDNKIFLEQTAQEVLNIVEALQFYKDNVIKLKYQNLIDKQLELIAQQLKLQNINILLDNGENRYNFDDIVLYEGNDAIIIGMSDEDCFIKIATIEDGKFKIIEIPICLLEKRKNDGKK